MRFLNIRATWLATALAVVALLLPSTVNAQSTLKVLDWNTHHGVGADGVYNLQRFVDGIAASGADVVSLNEVERLDSWGNEDQPARYASLLKAATGRTWYYTFAQRDGGSTGQGNLILSAFPIEAAEGKTLSYSRSVARAQITVNGARVNIFSTHLDADSAARRVTQMAELKAWVSGFSQQHIIGGDFNAWPGAAEISNMTAFCYDAWATAKTAGTSIAYAGNEAGNTRNSRIDYIWYSKNATKLTLQGAQVFDTGDASDHRPVMAIFKVGSGSEATDPGTDFNGDHKLDLSIYRPSTGEWWSSLSGGAGVLRITWGVSAFGDVPTPGDYDGDNKTDIAVFRPVDATWYVRLTGTATAQNLRWGNPGDVPAAGDYDGDGRTDLAVFRPANGSWYVRASKTGALLPVAVWGMVGDVPVPGDYDGDRKTDIAVYRPATGTWYVRYSSNGTTGGFVWGTVGDVVVPGDYDGDGRTDFAVFRPSSGTWYVRHSTGTTFAFVWGVPTDRPAAADYDGDGRTDLAVFRPSTGLWYLRYSSTGATAGMQWGGGEDVPVVSR